MRKLLSQLAVAAAVTVVAQHPTKMNVTMSSGDVITYQIADIYIVNGKKVLVK